MPVPVGDQKLHEWFRPAQRAVQSGLVGGMHACEDGLVIRAHSHVNHLSAADAPIDNGDSRVARFRRQINTDRSHSRNIPRLRGGPALVWRL